MSGRPRLLTPVTLGGTRPPTLPRACCPCGQRHRVTSEARRLYCGCGRVLLLDWVRAG